MTPRPIVAVINKLTFQNNIGKMSVETAELHTEDKHYLSDNEGKEGFFYFQQAPMGEVFIPKVGLGEFETKTPSQRMRAVIWRIWEANGKKGKAEDYYKSTMEKIIDQLKEKLN